MLDTNILISGTFWSGASFEILRTIDRGSFQLIVSKSILEEYLSVIKRDEILDKKKYTLERSKSALKLLNKAILVRARQISLVKKDRSDDKFIEAAVAGHAKVIITKDGHLLSLGKYRDISIITPEEFLLTYVI